MANFNDTPSLIAQLNYFLSVSDKKVNRVSYVKNKMLSGI